MFRYLTVSAILVSASLAGAQPEQPPRQYAEFVAHVDDPQTAVKHKELADMLLMLDLAPVPR